MSRQSHSRSAPFYALATPAILIVTVIAVLFAYQNCADPSQFVRKDYSIYADAPFAYDVSMDTIGYMSCDGLGGNYDQLAFWTFKLGAYTEYSGIGLNRDFIEYAGIFEGRDPVSEILTQSDFNQDTQLQLAIRPRPQPQAILSPEASDPEEGQHYVSLLGSLTDPDIRDHFNDFRELTERFRYIKGMEGVGGRKLEGSLHFANMMPSVREHLGPAQDGVIALTYTSPNLSQPYHARGPAEFVEDPRPSEFMKVWGRGFKPVFRSSAGNNDHQVENIQEFDLYTGRDLGAQWDCSTRYQVVRPQDEEECSVVSEPLEPSQRHQIARRLLRAEDWRLNSEEMCAVPRRPGECYGELDDGISVSYSTTESCGEGTNMKCPHYISICFRAN